MVGVDNPKHQPSEPSLPEKSVTMPYKILPFKQYAMIKKCPFGSHIKGTLTAKTKFLPQIKSNLLILMVFLVFSTLFH